MKRTLVVAGCISLILFALSGCAAISAVHNVQKAAKGLADAPKIAQDYQAKLDKSKTLTYTATYTVKTPGSPDQTVTIAQKPPKSVYKQADSVFLDDGSKIYTCSKSDGKDQCIELGPHIDGGFLGAGAGGFGGFAFAFNPATFVGLYVVAAIVPGVEVTKSQRDVAGLKSDCNTITLTQGNDKGKKLEGCTSTDGIFTYSYATDGSEATLTKYETSASDSAFTLPAKAQSSQDLINNATSSTSTGRTTTSTTIADTTTSTVADTSTSSPDTSTSSSVP